MSDAFSPQQWVATIQRQQEHTQLLGQQGPQHAQEREQLLLGGLGGERQAQCLQALLALRLNGFQVLLQPAGTFPAVIQLTGSGGAARLQAESAEHVGAQQAGSWQRPEAPVSLLEGLAVLPGPPRGSELPAAVASAAAPAVAADAIATIFAPGRRANKQQAAPPAEAQSAAASIKAIPLQSRKRKAAAEPAAAAAAVEGAPAAAADTDSKYRDSLLLAFGQELADQVLAHLKGLETSAESADCYKDLTTVMRLLQPIVDRMQQEDLEALGEPITPEHKAYVAAGSLRYEQVEQLFSQMNLGEASKSLGIGKTKFKTICRKFGIIRWPYREFHSIYLAQDHLDAKSSKANDAHQLPGRRLLLSHALHLLQQHPNVKLKEHPASVLTQAFHKQKYKKKKIEERHADEAAAQVLTHIAAAGSGGGCSPGGSISSKGTA